MKYIFLSLWFLLLPLYSATTTNNESSWIDLEKQSITLHTPIFFWEAQYLTKQYPQFDTFIYRGKDNFTVCIVNINKKDINSLFDTISSDIPTAKITSKKELTYFYIQKFSTKGLFIQRKNNVPSKKSSNKYLSKKENQLLKNSKIDFNTKKYNKAIISLTEFISNNNEHIESNFLLGRSYQLTRQFELALFTYQKILIINENLPRVRLELAQTYLNLNMTKEALSEFNYVLSSNIPKAVRHSVRKRIKFIKSKDKKHTFNYLLSINFLNDDNINDTTSQPSYDIFAPNYDAYLNIESDEIQSDTSSKYQFGVVHNYKTFDNLAIETNLFLTSQVFTEFTEKNNDLISLSSYFTKTTVNDKLSIGINFIHNILNNTNYQKDLGFNIIHQKYVALNTIRTVNFKIFQKKFYEENNKDKESDNIQLSINHMFRTQDFGNINLLLLANSEEKLQGARTDVNNGEFGILLSNSYQWSSNLLSTISFSSTKTSYKIQDINFLNKREDTRNISSLSFKYNFTNNLSVNLNLTNTKVKSNQTPYDYKKTTQNISIVYYF